MAEMFDRAPVDTYEEVCQTFLEQFGKHPEEVFQDFSREPIASASLAQVHTAFLEGEKVAVKILHHGLRDRAEADIWMTEVFVKLVKRLFPEVDYQWLVDQTKETLPKELDFRNEWRNCERSQAYFQENPGLDGQVVFPGIKSDFSGPSVLTMSFMEVSPSYLRSSIHPSVRCFPSSILCSFIPFIL